MKVFEQASDLIGNTPLVRLNGYQKEKKLNAELLAKLEYFNPAGSVKDRVALYMLLDAQEKGLLKRDSLTDKWQYRNRTCRSSRRKGNPDDHCDAGYHEH